MSSEMQIAGGVSTHSVENAGLSAKPSTGWPVHPTGSNADFGNLLSTAIGNVDALEQKAKVAVDGLMRGNGVDVHQAMIAAEKANAAFELALAMRNKAVQCYQSVMSMQF
jgi:flagellar hook-basal body complex protein FliE